MLSSKGKKWFLIFLGIFLILLVTAQSLVHLFVEPTIEGFVKELVEVRSNSRYKVGNLEVTWNLSARTIYIKDLNIRYDPSQVVDTADAPENIFGFEFPLIELKRIHIREYLATGRIRSERLFIKDPEISCIRESRVNRDPQKEQRRLYDMISPQIKEIQIDEFDLEGGKISYNDDKNFQRNSFIADNLNFSARGVTMDSTSGFDFLTWFKVEEADMEIDVDQYIHVTQDSSYVLKAGKIGLSSNKSEFYVRNLHIEPNFRKSIINRSKRKNLFEIKVPQLLIQGIKPREIAINRDAKLGSVRIIEPSLIQLGVFTADSVREDFPSVESLYQDLKPYLNTLYVDGLSIEKGSFYKMRELADTSKNISLEGIGLYMRDIALDSTAVKEKKFLLSEELDLKIDSYQFLLKEGTYSLVGKDARISTFEKLMKGADIQINPLTGTRKRLIRNKQDILDLEVPELSIEGVDLEGLWYKQNLDVSQILIQQPALSLTNYPEIKQEKIDEISNQNLNQLIGGYLNKLAVRKLDIKEGTFDFSAGKDVLGNGFKARDLSVSIRNFNLDPRNPKNSNRPFYADDIRVNLKVDNYSLTLPDSSYNIEVKHLGIATADSSFFADSIYFTPLDTKNQEKILTAKLFIPHGYFNGLDIYQSYFQENLALDSLYLSGMHIYMQDHRVSVSDTSKSSILSEFDAYQFLSKSFKSLSVRRLGLEKGSFEFEQMTTGQKFVVPNFNLDMFRLKIDSSANHKDALFYSDEIKLKTDKITQMLADSVHQLSLDGLSLSTRTGNLQICGVNISPKNTGTESINQEYHINIPELGLKGLNWYKLLEEREAEMLGFYIDTPRVELQRYPDIVKEEIDSLAKSDLYGLISKQLNVLQVGEFKINQGKLRVNDYKEGTNEFKAEGLNLSVTDFRLDSTSSERTDNLFYAKRIDLGAKVEDYYFMLPDSNYALRIGNVGISTQDSSIFADNLRLLPQWNNQKLKHSDQVWEIEIPSLSLAGIDPNEWYFHKKLEMGRLLLKEPIIRQVILKNDTSKAELNLYEILHPYVNTFKIGNLHVDNSTFLQDRLEEDTLDNQNFKGLSLSARNFELDSLGMVRRNRLFYSDDVDLKLKKHEYPFQDSMYTFTFKELRISTEDGKIEVDSARILPNFEIVDFVMKRGYAENRLYLQTHKVSLEKMDVYKMIKEGKLWMENVRVLGLDFRVNKDGRFRMKPGRRPPFPQQMIQNLSVPITIGRVDVLGGAVNFQLKTGFMRQPGVVYLTNINARIKGISNDPEYLAVHPTGTILMETEATLMNKGKLATNFMFSLKDTLYTYSFKGKVGAWDMTELNPIMMPAGRIRIKQGTIKSTAFEVFGDKYQSRGNMTMRYNDLKVSVLDEKGGEKDAIRRRPLLSAIANSLVVKQDNPNRRFLRYGKIKYEVDPEKGFVNHWVQAVLSGVKSSVGMEEVGRKNKKEGLKSMRKEKVIP